MHLVTLMDGYAAGRLVRAQCCGPVGFSAAKVRQPWVIGPGLLLGLDGLAVGLAAEDAEDRARGKLAHEVDAPTLPIPDSLRRFLVEGAAQLLANELARRNV